MMFCMCNTVYVGYPFLIPHKLMVQFQAFRRGSLLAVFRHTGLYAPLATVFSFAHRPAGDMLSPQVTNPHFKWGFDFNPSGVVPGFRQRRDFADLFYWLPSKEGISTFFRPLTCHFLPVLECTLVLSLRSHCLPSKHNNLLPRNACLPICFDILDVCRKASVYSFLSDMT